MEFTITRAEFGGAAYRDMVALRHRLLREPLGLSFTDQQLAAEKDQLHLALWQNGIVIGTVLLLPPDSLGTAKLRQMAVEPVFAGRGCGRALLDRAEQESARLGTRRITLSARQSAIGFYGRCGYVAQGEPFVEVTIPHISMVKTLHPAD